jgi:hypothetical protein
MAWVLMVFHAFESAPYIFVLLITMNIGRFVKVLLERGQRKENQIKIIRMLSVAVWCSEFSDTKTLPPRNEIRR